MNIEAFLLCDAATDSNGKLNVLGAFDTLFVASVPAAHPQCAVALRLRLERSEQGEHHIAVHFVDEDGQHLVGPLEGKFRVAGQPGHSGGSNLILNLQGLQLKRHGEIAIHLLIDGRHMASLPLYVRKPPEMGPSARVS